MDGDPATRDPRTEAGGASAAVLGTSVTVREVSKTFGAGPGAVEALRSASVEAGPGEFVTIIGPSGCGKSTLFNIVAGLLEPDSGEVRLGDADPSTSRLGEIAYMPQKDLLFPWRRVVDNAAVGLQLAGMSRTRARERVEALLPPFGLEGFARAYPWQLSGGMRQRVAFLRTVVQDRPALLLDEPFGALDSLTRAEMQQWLLDVWEEFRRTVVFITHDVAEAVFLSDRVHVMTPRPGRICATVEIDLPRPRRLEVELTPEFGALERRLRAALREGAGD